MKVDILRSFSFFRRLTLFSISLSLVILTCCLFANAQQQAPAQLSLADILIGLRSKKATIEEKNKLLSDAAQTRGTTFALTPEIEKELENTGADKNLISTLRRKSPAVKAETAAQVKPPAVPVVSAPPPPDANFYRQSAKEHFGKGEFEPAIIDLNKAVELNPKDAAAYLERGVNYYNLKNYESAVLDYDHSIELNATNAIAYLRRGDAYEKIGDNLKAMENYQKSLDLDQSNETAKTGLQRLQAVEAAKNLPKTPPPAPVVAETPKIPESIELGQLNGIAIKLAVPVYPDFAKKSNIQGLVTVIISLDEEGKVTSAKSVSGPSLLRPAAEEAARRTKFNPATLNNQPIKATGFLSYNFKL